MNTRNHYDLNFILILANILFFLSFKANAQYYFTEHAHEARWETSVVDQNSNALPGTTTTLVFGNKGSANGEAKLSRNRMEDNTMQNILFTHPKWSKNGTIKGWFPPISTIPKESRLKGKIGFIKPNGNPGTDGARFMIWAHYYIDGNEQWDLIYDHYKKYTGQLESFNLDLKKYEGRTAFFELRVDAGEHSGQDWAAWVAPRVENPNAPKGPNFKKIKLTFLGVGYPPHNDDCSRINLDLKAYALYTNPYKPIRPNSLDIQLIKWGEQEKSGIWIKRNREFVDYRFKITPTNAHFLKSKQASHIFNIDMDELKKGNVKFHIGHTIKFCHKSCDLCTDFSCKGQSGIRSFTNDYNIKELLKGNSFVYFSTKEIPTPSGGHPYRIYFKVEVF